MGTFSFWHWLVVLAIVLILFGGGGKLSRLMGDFGKGLNAFKKSVKDEQPAPADDPKALGSGATPSPAPAPEKDSVGVKQG